MGILYRYLMYIIYTLIYVILYVRRGQQEETCEPQNIMNILEPSVEKKFSVIVKYENVLLINAKCFLLYISILDIKSNKMCKKF